MKSSEPGNSLNTRKDSANCQERDSAPYPGNAELQLGNRTKAAGAATYEIAFRPKVLVEHLP
jgi:hypothetical protein